MATKIVYVLTRNPRTEREIVSAALAQALTAVSFEYECEIFLMGDAVDIVKKGALEGVKFETSEPITTMVQDFLDMDGVIYVCHPASDARNMHEGDVIEGVSFVNASKLLENSKDANAVFTF